MGRSDDAKSRIWKHVIGSRASQEATGLHRAGQAEPYNRQYIATPLEWAVTAAQCMVHSKAPQYSQAWHRGPMSCKVQPKRRSRGTMQKGRVVRCCAIDTGACRTYHQHLILAGLAAVGLAAVGLAAAAGLGGCCFKLLLLNRRLLLDWQQLLLSAAVFGRPLGISGHWSISQAAYIRGRVRLWLAPMCVVDLNIFICRKWQSTE